MKIFAKIRVNSKNLAPGTRVMFLLKEKDDGATPALFTEMGELSSNEWRETARWVKFEEDVEQGKNDYLHQKIFFFHFFLKIKLKYLRR